MVTYMCPLKDCDFSSKKSRFDVIEHFKNAHPDVFGGDLKRYVVTVIRHNWRT